MTTLVLAAGALVGEGYRSPRARAADDVEPSESRARTADDSGRDPRSGRLAEAKVSRNPIADTGFVLFQFNTHHEMGPNHDKTQIAPNLQPLVPFRASSRWNVITRTVIPFARVPELAPGVGPATGLGDVTLYAWPSPVPRGAIVWGIGPAAIIPTATDRLLGAGKFSAGPSGVVAYVRDPWVAAAIIQNVWSFAGDSSRAAVDQMSLQLLATYGLGNRWYVTSGPLITADWNASAQERWLLPLGGGFGKVVRFGEQPVDFTVQSFYNAVRPTAGPEWQLRLSVNVLLPRRR